MERYLSKYIQKDLGEKIVLITGPRQVGKTTLAKGMPFKYDYFNYDRSEDRLILKKANWDRKKELIILDELHKMSFWKRWLKGIYDTEGVRPRLLVTGSAKLNAYRKIGDSMAGRYFCYRLHPFDLHEVNTIYDKEEAFQRLWYFGGFPEPFLNGSQTFYNRWKRTYFDAIIRQDLLDLKTIRDIQAVETLIELLKNNVGSTISYANLARILEKDAKTVKEWLQLLEDLYVIFKVTPFANKLARSLRKEPKYYFFDCAQVTVSDGAKLENLVAAALLKELQFLADIYGKTTNLHFLRTKDGREIDFCLVIDGKPTHLIEVKLTDDEPSRNFSYFGDYFPKVAKLQLVKEIRHEKSYANNVDVRNLVDWLYQGEWTKKIRGT